MGVQDAVGLDGVGRDTEDTPASYARQVGERLRLVRRQQHLSLQAVEAMCGQEFKASVLGAYERGERAISVHRLQRLAAVYHVPVDQLLPREGVEVDLTRDGAEAALAAAPGKVSIDLTRLDVLDEPERDLIRRYLAMIQVQRQDFNGRVLTVREDDLRAIAALIAIQPDEVRGRLQELGLRL